MKILVCDYVGNAQKWLDNFTIKKNYEVIGTITPESAPNQKSLLSEKSWDYLLIFEQNARNFFTPLIQFFNITAERVIYALDAISWTEHPAALYSLINLTGGGGTIYRTLILDQGRKLNYFTTCTTDAGIHYVATSSDVVIMRDMYLRRKNWAEIEMQFFQYAAKYFYKVDESSGYFLDLGANIGTTGIYFIKKIAPKLKLLAFEPDPENFKLLRTNLILNDLYENSIVENFGLGIYESEQTMYKVNFNPGGSGMFSNTTVKNAPAEKIKLTSLDRYFADNHLNAAEIKYIWIDTEGFEPQVLLGAQNILRQNPAPVFMEFNPQWWQKSGYYEKMMMLLKEIYVGYIWVQESIKNSKATAYPIEKLWEYQTEHRQLGDIFLIKKS